ncbi:tRNA lysidine(34) synthetase TilS [Roseovarius aestuariivivens]|uniref:tRNA lysidine(34) synthetase TilS n=1 Tax=Roseovarius aestuariivivens TaxID=1888910 RepID=UPI0010815B9F|nr:tRNA lysidine(34) synthetase TilS [Roseovarius aestuariivivens]
MTERSALLCERVAAHFGPRGPDRLGIGVSGGSDSLGLLVLLADWSDHGGPEVSAVTVDHGLRPEAADEARHVAMVCRELNISHDVVIWDGWDGQGNLPDKARRARYGLMAEWARTHEIGHVAVAHTLDDQAETFVMRLAREAGLDGLSAMARHWRLDEVQFCRPALSLSRDDLRSVLRARKIDWVDDPSNSDTGFERVRVRQALDTLEELGISARTLSNVAHHMGEVRETVYWYAFVAARDCVRFQSGDVIIDRATFRTLPRDIARRLVQQVLHWLSGAEYPPRGRSVDLLLEAIRGGTNMTLHGCMMTVDATTLRFSREFMAVAQARCRPEAPWDGRWRLQGPWGQGVEIAALGEGGLENCPDWRDSGLPASSLAAGPAVWRGQRLIAAPLAGLRNGWQATLIRDEDHFFAAFLAH